MKRRHFIQYTAAGVALPTLLNGFSLRALASSPLAGGLEAASADNDHVLVLIQMGGGNDGLNTIVPIDQYDRLNRLRPQVILPENKLLSITGQDKLALHPAMEGVRGLYDQGLMQIVQSVGYPNPNYSHFRATDIWLTGSSAEEVLGTGWAGRYLAHEYPNYPAGYPNLTMPDPLSLEIGYSQSVMFQGPATGMGMAITDPEYFYTLVEGGQAPAPATLAGEQLSYVRLIASQSNLYNAVVSQAWNRSENRVTYPDRNYLAQQLKIVARLIAGGLKTRIYLVHIDGFDTHDNQVVASDHTLGEHADLLRQLSTAMTAFMRDIKSLGVQNRVLAMTFSEFGRRIIANNSNGTDHGSAAPVMIFGHGIEGGVIGHNPLIPGSASVDDNIPMQTDFRSLYATLMQDWFCVPSEDLNGISLGEFPTLPLIRVNSCVPDTIRQLNEQAGKLLLVNTPNPFGQSTRLTFESVGGQTMIQIFDRTGRLITTPVSQYLEAGDYTYDWDTGTLPSGSYYARLQTGSLAQVRTLLKL
ncbi:MAG: DUF1501 domain-containing protein [Bacteroidia bacterium]|nr:DUF1501 domain-containing protein [Bacteroidia bacterium]